MKVGVNLHVHERTASVDSRTPASHMAEAYCNVVSDFSLVGFVGHDQRPHPARVPKLSFTGIEHTVDWGGHELHVVEFPGQEFSFLAHPGMTFATNVKMQAMEVVEELGLDGVEKYNAGRKQYEGSIATNELAGDDAHSPLGVGRSFMWVDVSKVSKSAIMAKIRRGEFEVVNSFSFLYSAVHLFEKSAAIAAERLTALPGSIQYGSQRTPAGRE